MSKPVKSPEPIRQVNRCASCWKRIGLTEFRCRCGDLFCGEHRYSDPHVCGYDYKGVRREANTRANPVVKAAMIVKISGENLGLAVSFSINFKLVFLRNPSLIISLQMDVTSDEGDRPWESYHTVFTNAKAGMDGVDKEKVQRVVYEMSKGSKYFENEQKKEAIILQKIEHMRVRSAKLMSSDLSHFQMIADKKIIELEASRVLSRIWLHVDMDAFYAAVETLENPSLKGKPLAVGSLSMISTANYEARTFGVRAAMPGFIARKLCPDLTFVPVDFKKYTHYSEVIRKVFYKYDPHFIATSLDEAYLDITEVCRESGMSGAEIAEEIRAAVNKETGLTCSAGVGPNRLLAKVCSDINKPNGQFVLPNERMAVMTFISSLPIRKIGGIGKVTEHVLRDVLGINTCEEMIKKSAYIVALFSSCSADFFLSVALGIGNTDTPQSKMRKSISSERTFSATEDEALIFKRLSDIAENLSNDMEKEGLSGRTLTLKVKTASFEVRSRAVTLQNSISSKEDILCHASKLLKAEFPLSLRLIGLRMSQFGDEKCGLADRTQKTITDFVFFGDASLKKTGSDSSSVLEINGNQSSDENEIGHWATDVSMGPSNYDHLLEYESKSSSLGNDASEKRNYSEPMKHEEFLAKMVNDTSTITTHVIQPDGIEGSELLEREACSSSAQANHIVGGPCKMSKISNDKWAISSNQDQCTWIDDYKCSLCGFELPPNFDKERQDHSDYHFAEMLQKEEFKHGSSNLLQKRFHLALEPLSDSSHQKPDLHRFGDDLQEDRHPAPPPLPLPFLPTHLLPPPSSDY